MNKTSRTLAILFSGAIVLTVLVYLAMAAAAPPDRPGGLDLAKAGTFPIYDHGRLKPLDTLARTSLMVISGGKQTYKDADGNTHSAMEWLLDVMTSQQRFRTKTDTTSADVPAYRIESPALQRLFDLEPREGSLYSLNELLKNEDARKKPIAEATRVRKLDPEQRSQDDQSLLDLMAQAITHSMNAGYETPHRVFRITNDQVLSLLGLKPRPEEGYRYTFGEIVPRLQQLKQEAMRARRLEAKDMSVYDVQVLEAFKHVNLYVGIAEGDKETLFLVARLEDGQDWITLPQARSELERAAKDGPEKPRSAGLGSVLFVEVLNRYAACKSDPASKRNVDAFNDAVNRYAERVKKLQPAEASLVETEAGFNQFAPFYQCLVLYVAVFLVACVSWLWRDSVITWTAFGIGVLVLLIHTWALCERMYIQGRPPVTNLYSSAVFIGWMCVCIGLIVEAIFRNGVAAAVGGLLGFCTLLIGDHLGLSGDTLEMMQAVLDTNFWLATHVTCVTIGYASTFVAGVFGMLYILAGIVTAVGRKADPDFTLLDRHLSRLLGQITYGIVCFAMLFSFVGTILGGLWADYSWGRFWGWDPKENGALLIVIMNALILHARWGGMVKERGVAVLAVAGTLVTMWSWFGTNQLGIGLHAYGFNNSLVRLCRWYWLIQLGVVGVGMLPLRVWNPPPEVAPKSSGLAAAPLGKKKARRDKAVQLRPEFG